MSNYSQITAFTPKDSLATGNPAKIIKGSEFDAEFSAISAAITSKTDITDTTAHTTNTSNPHSVTKTQVGLSNVDNTSDANKPVSTATQTALDAKVTGPATTTDNTIARYDGSTGKLIQSSSATLDDAGNLSAAGGTFSGNVTVGGGTLGYGAGSGGTVTQATSKSTAVTLNKPAGQITTHNAALAAGASVSFDINTSSLTAGDGVVVTPVFGPPGWDNYTLRVMHYGVGAFRVVVTNTSGGSLSEALIFTFQVIKGSTT